MGRAAQFLLDSCAHAGIPFYTLELTTPGRDEANQGRFGAQAVRHALGLYLSFCLLLVRRRVRLVYLPIAQWGLPLTRDLCLAVTATLLNIPVVIHLHGSQLVGRVSRPANVSDRLIRFLLHRKTWAVLSTPLRDTLLSSGAASRVRVLRNPAFPSVSDAPTGPSAREINRLRVGFLGLCCTEKGLDIVVDAAARLRVEGGIEVELVVAGPLGDFTPPSAPWLTYLGKVDPAELQTAFWPDIDVLALPARWEEGLPFAVLEALQHGKLVLASDSLGLRELTSVGAVAAVRPSVEGCFAALASAHEDLSELIAAQQDAWARLLPLFDPVYVRLQWLEGLGLQR